MTVHSTRGIAARSLFDRHLPSIRGAFERAAIRKLPKGEAEDFVSWALLQIIETDYRCLRRLRTQDRLVAFVARVAVRMAVDYLRLVRGTWRPSAAARRHGELGVALERLVRREKLGLVPAITELRQHFRDGTSTARLREIAAALPARVDRVNVLSVDAIDLPCAARASDRVRRGEQLHSLERVAEVVRDCLATVEEDDRQLLVARFVEGRTVASLAEELGVPAKWLYRRFESSLAEIRRRATERGLTPDQIRGALEALAEASVDLLPSTAPECEALN